MTSQSSTQALGSAKAGDDRRLSSENCERPLRTISLLVPQAEGCSPASCLACPKSCKTVGARLS